MRIAIITDAWFPLVGGVQIHIWELCRLLIKYEDLQIDIFVRAVKVNNQITNQQEEYFNGRVKLIRCKPVTSFFNPFGRILSIFTLIYNTWKNNRIKKYDLIHAHFMIGSLCGKVVSKILGIPVIITNHGTHLTDTNTKSLSRIIENLICFKLHYDYIISVNKNYYNKMVAKNRKIAYLPNGVDLQRFDSIEDISIKKELTFLFVGRFEWTKGLDNILEAIQILKQSQSAVIKNRKVSFKLVGYGYDIGKYELYIKNNKLFDLVKILGKKTGSDLVAEYKKASVCLMPSLTEGDPLVLKEAWAAKIPVLGTYCKSTEYMIENEVDGWLVEKGNSQQLASKILEIIKLPPEKITTMGLQGYHKVKENYQWEQIADKHYQIYQDIINNKKS